MMKGQAAMTYVDATIPTKSPCAWCGKPWAGDFEVEPAKYRKHGQVRVVAKRATIAPVCREHLDRFRRDARNQRVAKEAGKWSGPDII